MGGLALLANALGPEVTLTEAIIGATAGPPTALAGGMKVSDGITGKDTSEAQDALQSIATPGGLAVLSYTQDAKDGALASTAENLGAIVANPASVASPAGALAAAPTVGDAPGFFQSIGSAIRGFFSSSPSPQPAQAGKPAATPCNTVGSCQ